MSAADGFALAGSGALREHRLVDRPTEDVDLFTSSVDVGRFASAVEAVVGALRADGLAVDEVRRAAGFARLHVAVDGLAVEVDMGIDWRESDPVTLAAGPVLALPDAVGNKVSALFGRGEARDYYDVDAIRRAAVFSDAELVAAAKERDAGFDESLFADALDRLAHLGPAGLVEYGVSASQFEEMVGRSGGWAVELRSARD